jgi:hypothetical protein
MPSGWFVGIATLAAMVIRLSSMGVLVGLAGAACGQAASEPAARPSLEEAPSASDSSVSDSPAADAPAPSGKRAPCTLGADQTCNADPAVSALWGRCTELGVCQCRPGFALNPRGSCQPSQ